MSSDISKTYSSYYESDAAAVQAWCQELYQDRFGHTFEGVREMSKRLNSKEAPITDAELSWILIDLPLEMFKLSESLNKFRLELEVVKLKRKDRKRECRKEIEAEYAQMYPDKKLTATLADELVSQRLVEDDILTAAFSSVVTRVENEISFSRELIMGAKKIWDSRRTSEVAPVGEVVPSVEDLPDYVSAVTSGKSYIG